MQFRAAGFCLLHKIVQANPALRTVYMAKMDLSNAYMRVWLSIKDVPKLTFVVPSVPGETNILIDFHLFLLIGLMDSCPLFCVVTETIADMVNNANLTVQPLYSLELLAYTAPLPDQECYIVAEAITMEETHLKELFLQAPPEAKFQILRYVDVYIDNFVLLQQGTSKMRRNALRALFHTIDQVIWPNHAEDNTRTAPNSTKKLKLG